MKEEGMSEGEIAKKLKLDKSVILRFCVRTPMSKNLKYRLVSMRENGATLKEISNHFGCANSQISRVTGDICEKKQKEIIEKVSNLRAVGKNSKEISKETEMPVGSIDRIIGDLEIKEKKQIISSLKGKMSLEDIAKKVGLTVSSVQKLGHEVEKRFIRSQGHRTEGGKRIMNMARSMKKKGMTRKDIMKALNIKPTAYNTYTRDIKIQKATYDQSISDILKMREKGLTRKEIAGHVGASLSQVERWISIHNKGVKK